MPIFADSFEYNSLEVAMRRGWSFSDPSNTVITTHWPHRSLNGFGGRYTLRTGNNNDSVYTPVFSTQTARWCHYWLKTSDGNNYNVTFIAEGWEQFTIDIDSGGTMRLRRGGATGAVVATSSGSIDLSEPHWYEIELVVHNSSGVCNVYIDNDVAAFVSFSGDTQAANNPTFSGWHKVHFGNNTQFGWIDDVIVTDPTEGQLGETYGRAMYVAGDNTTALTPNGEAENWKNVLVWGETNYNSGATTATGDLYDIQGNLALGTVDFISVLGLIGSQNDLRGRPVLKSGATTDLGSLGGGPSSYVGEVSYYTQNPDTASAWTESGVNSIQVGTRTEP